MATTIRTQRYSNLIAEREVAITKQITLDGITEGMGVFVDASDDWSLSLDAGKLIIDGTVIEEDAQYVNLWDYLDLLGAGAGPNPGDGKHFLFYAEYKLNTTPLAYRFLHGDYDRPATLNDIGDATYDPNHADAAHLLGKYVKLADVWIPDTASSIEDCIIHREPLLNRYNRKTKTFMHGQFKLELDSGDRVLSWSDFALTGISEYVSEHSKSRNAFSLVVESPDAGIAPYDFKINMGAVPSSIRGGMLYVNVDWFDPFGTVTLKYLDLSEEDFESLMNDDNTDPDVRFNFDDIIVVGWFMDGSISEPSTIFFENGQALIMKGSPPSESAVMVNGWSSSFTRGIKATSYPSAGTIFNNDAGVIDLDDIILNLDQLSDLGLNEVYDSTTVGHADGDGRTINVDGGAVRLINEYGEGDPSFSDPWASALSIELGGQISPNEIWSRGIAVFVDDDSPYGTEYPSVDGSSGRKGLVMTVPYAASASGITISRIGTPPNEKVVIGNDPLFMQDVPENRAVYLQFILADDTQEANNKIYVLDDQSGNLIVTDINGSDEGLSGDFDSAGNLATPITNETVKFWIVDAEIAANKSFFNKVDIRNLSSDGELSISSDKDMTIYSLGENITIGHFASSKGLEFADANQIINFAGDLDLNAAGSINIDAEDEIVINSDTYLQILCDVDFGESLNPVDVSINGTLNLSLCAVDISECAIEGTSGTTITGIGNVETDDITVSDDATIEDLFVSEINAKDTLIGVNSAIASLENISTAKTLSGLNVTAINATFTNVNTRNVSNNDADNNLTLTADSDIILNPVSRTYTEKPIRVNDILQTSPSETLNIGTSNSDTKLKGWVLGLGKPFFAGIIEWDGASYTAVTEDEVSLASVSETVSLQFDTTPTNKGGILCQPLLGYSDDTEANGDFHLIHAEWTGADEITVTPKKFVLATNAVSDIHLSFSIYVYEAE